MTATRVFTPLPIRSISVRTLLARTRFPPIAHQNLKQARGIAQDHSDLGGVEGSEPPGPKPNRHNWIAGTITVTAVLFIGWRMRVAKLRQKEEAAKA